MADVVGVSKMWVFVLLGVSGEARGLLFNASAAAFKAVGDSLGEVLSCKAYSSTNGASWLFSKLPGLLN